MKIWDYVILFGLSLGLTLVIAGAIQVPGYMDAEYYFAGGIEFASGKGFYEPFLWNYLDDPQGLPHPAATYWMPLASFVTASGITISGRTDYFSARIIFFLFASLVPVLTAWLAYKLTSRKVTSWTAAGLALFSGFYAVYLGLTETFTLYMLLGSIFMVVSVSSIKPVWKPILLGLLAGLLHLSRADGLLWLIIGAVCLVFEGRLNSSPTNFRKVAASLGVFAAVYLFVTGFWYIRNVQVLGGLFPPGTNRAIWLVDYDQLYNFPASTLTLQNWLGAGFPRLLLMRWNALLENMQTLLAVQGGIFLLPLILVGGWRLKQYPLIWVGSFAWIITFLVMTFIFPLAGSRGGFLHSGAAFQPLFWTAAAEGLAGFVNLGVKLRNWKFERAMIGFGILIVSVAGVVTLGLSATRIAQGDEPGVGWSAGYDAYSEVENALKRLSVPQGDVIMVNNPPGFFVATGRPSVVIPNGDVQTVLAAAEKYQVRFLILEKNTVKDLIALYLSPVDLPGLKYVETVGRSHIFQIQNP